MKFDEAVYEKTKEIPRGKVATYKEIAMAIGNAGACRAVGNALNRNPHSPKVPCHRVIKSDRSLGGFAKGPNTKKKLLKSEGVKFDGDRVMQEFLFRLCRS